MPTARNRWRFDAAASRRPRTALAALCAALGAVILAEGLTAPPGAEESAPLPAAGPGEAAPDNALLAGAILERPLFTPGRHAVSAPVAVGAPGAASFRWRLAGTLVTPGRREALFAQADQQLAAAEGMSVDDWEVVSIRPDGVTLSRGGVRKELKPAGAVSAPGSLVPPGAFPPPQPGPSPAAQKARRFFPAPAPVMAPAQPGGTPPHPLNPNPLNPLPPNMHDVPRSRTQ